MEQTFFDVLYFRVAPNTGGANEQWNFDGTNLTSQNNADLGWIGITGIMSNNKAYYMGDIGGFGLELCVFDGTNPPQRLTDINTSGSATSERPVEFQGKLYFSATDGTTGNELWVYDPAIVGINEINSINISIYPNPAMDQLIIKTEELKIINIDITGKIVKRLVSNSNIIDVSNLVTGIYFLQIQTESGIANSKFIKE